MQMMEKKSKVDTSPFGNAKNPFVDGKTTFAFDHGFHWYEVMLADRALQ
jgi:hypothetical protein